MAHVRFYAGVALLLFGVVAITGIVPLSIFATAPPTVDCSGYPSSGCTVGAQISDTGSSGLTSPFTAYFVYKNTGGQTVLIDAKPITISSGQTVAVTDTFPSSAAGDGLGFTVSVFVFDANGAPAGVTQSSGFSVPTSFIIDYGGVGSITVSPPGQSVSQCTSSCSGTILGGSWYRAYWPVGTVLTVTTSAGVAPVGVVGNLQSCPAQGSGFVCTVTVKQWSTVVITGIGGSGQSSNVIFVNEGQAGVATPNPISICLSASAQTLSGSIQCSPSGSFTLNVIQGYTWSGNLWKVTSGGTTVAQGNSTTVSLTYAQLSPSASFNSGQATMLLTTATGIPMNPTCTGTNCGPGGASCTLNPSSNAGVNVLVVDMTGLPIKGALVTGAGASAVSDSTGHALLCNFPVPSGNLVNQQGTITISAGASGYQSAKQDVNVVEGQTATATIRLSGGSPFGSAGFIVGLVSMVAGAGLIVTDLPGRKR